MIPIARPSIGPEEADAASKVILSGMLASGKEVSAFEEEFSKFSETSSGVATSNGTTALHAAQLALNIGPGDEVIVPSFTFIATATTVSMCGASPVMADIEETTYCIDPESVMEQITKKTKAIIGVHLFGQPCNIGALTDICEDHSLIFIEDCAQAHGAKYQGRSVGSFGTCGCFSFYPTKNMTCGEGGMVVTNDLGLSDRIRRLVNHGQKEKYLHTDLGYNYRLTDIAAVIGRVQLQRLAGLTLSRQENGEFYSNNIQRKGIITPHVRHNSTHVYHQYAIRVTRDAGISRDELAEYLHKKGIGTAIHYPVPVHEQPVYKGKVSGSDCPGSQLLSKEILSLPVYPSLTPDQRETICQAVNECE